MNTLISSDYFRSRPLKLIVSLLALSVLPACSWLFGDDGTFRDRSNDYRKAVIEPPLQLPDGVASEALDDSYAIPAISDRTSLVEKFVIPTPEPLAEDIDRDVVRINRLGKQRWILVDGAPGQVWPRLRGFLNLNQLAVQRADAVSGLIETAWLQPAGEGALKERYRLRIEQGVQRGTSEVYVLQADLRAGMDSWPEFSTAGEREKIMVQELAQYLADSAAAGTVSMLAQQGLDSAGKVTLEENPQLHSHLRLLLSFARAWASLGLALDKAGYEVEDLNRDQKTYYVSYQPAAEKEQKEGFFSKLKFWRSQGEGSKAALSYLIRIEEQSQNTMLITIERQDGEAMEKTETDQLLKLIKKHIA